MTTASQIQIAGTRIGPGQPCYLIAEAGVNHNGSLTRAFKLVDAAVAAGANAVKFQAFHAEKLTTAAAPKARYQQENTGTNESQRDMLRRLELSPADFRKLANHCRKRRITFLCTPFDYQSADELAALNIPAFKIPSGEITNFPFLRHIARKRKPIILSTGMSTLAEVDEAVRVLRAAGGRNIALLHCVSNYPTLPTDVNLRAMQTLATVFGMPVGFSDHTLGIAIPLAAAALGAQVLEKHFTMDRDLPGPDHRASLEPDELAALVRGIREVQQAIGHPLKEPNAAERETAKIVRRSVVTARAVAAQEVIDQGMVELLRPGTGIAPALLAQVLGRRARRALPAGTVLAWNDLC